jgi:cysteinyl-tRNA synthetase
MDDDFNTAEALAVLFDLANEANRTKDADSLRLLKGLAGVLGLLQRIPDAFLQGAMTAELDIEGLIQARLNAKKNKNFAEADAIRKQLAEAGIVLEDTPQGTTWRRA